jgi:hypothetical protein
MSSPKFRQARGPRRSRPGRPLPGRIIPANPGLNIILSAEGGIDGNVTGSLRRLYTSAIVPDGSVSALIRRGGDHQPVRRVQQQRQP